MLILKAYVQSKAKKNWINANILATRLLKEICYGLLWKLFFILEKSICEVRSGIILMVSTLTPSKMKLKSFIIKPRISEIVEYWYENNSASADMSYTVLPKFMQLSMRGAVLALPSLRSCLRQPGHF